MKHSSSNGIYLGISSIIFIISGYLVNLWLGRELGPTDYGVYGVIISLMTAVNIIQTAGLPQATSKFISSGIHDADEILSISLRLQIISTACITTAFFLLAYPLALLLNDQTLTGYIRATSLILPLYAIYALYSSYYNGLHQFKRQAAINISYSVAKSIFVIGLVYWLHLYGAIIGFIVAPFIALLLGFHWPKSSKNFKMTSLPIILFSLPLIGFAILSTLLVSIDLFFVKSLLLSNAAAGLYSASQNIARIPFYALGAFSMILLPIVSKSINNESITDTSIKIRQTLRYLFLLLIPGTVLIAITSRQLLSILYTSVYNEASQSLSILVIALAMMTIFTLLSNILIADDRPRIPMIIAFISLIAICFFSYLLIPDYGLVGAATATSIGTGISALWAYYFVRARFPGIIRWSSMAKIGLATAVLYGVSIFFNFSGLLWLVISYIVLTVVYISVLLFLREISHDDKKNLKKIIQALIPKRIPLFTPHE